MDLNAPIDERMDHNQRGEKISRPLDGSSYGMMIFQQDHLVYSNQKAAALFGCQPDDLQDISLKTISSYIHPDDHQLFLDLINSIQSGQILPIQPNIRLKLTDKSHYYVDLLVNLTLHQGEPALQFHWLNVLPEAAYSEAHQYQENEVMGNAVTASAIKTDVNQMMELILVNLRNVLPYDRVGLFLLDKDEHFILAGNTDPAEMGAIPARGFSDPVVLELQRTKKTLFVEDIQVDERFAAWPDMPPLHSWIGAPLIVDNKVTGFLSLGSLEIGAYGQNDAAIVQSFASQISSVLENAWLHEQSHRRTDELEVLSRFTIALGQAEGRRDILAAIMDQISNFFGAVRGVVLFPDEFGTSLQVKFSLEESLIGLVHPKSEDLLWQTYRSGRSRVITNLTDLINSQKGKIFADLFSGLLSAVLIPLKSGDSTTGLLCFGFKEQRDFPVEDINLYNTIAEIAGPSLHRAIMLEVLEKQVELRTQHLTTLYAINNFAGEQRDLSDILDQVLIITLEAMNNRAGAIYLLTAKEDKLRLVTHQNFPPDKISQLQNISLHDPIYHELLDAPLPQVLSHNDLENQFSLLFQDNKLQSLSKILTAPIRAKGQPLGLLFNFSDNIQVFDEEDIALFGTIADQIGMFVERAHLISQAEQAAVIEERQRLARELHDSVTQLLYSQVLFSGASLKVLNQDNLPLTEQYLTRIEQAAQQALKEMRLLVFELRPTDQLDENLVDAIRKRLDAVEKRSGMQTHLIIEGDLSLDKNIEISIYRIIQEALNNTLKHAAAKSVTVTIRQEGETFEIEIADDGCGFNYQECLEGGGMGLATMLERTALLGGKMQVETKPGAGTTVRATFGAFK